MLSTLSQRPEFFTLSKHFLGTELTWSQTIIVRECIFENQDFCFASR